MKYLLDTHTFLWMISSEEKLSKIALDIINNIDNQLYLSSVSGWEIAIKIQINKLNISQNNVIIISEQIAQLSINELQVTMKHSMYIMNLPMIHKDPFDRMLIAQSILEEMPIISNDKILRKYDIDAVW